MGHVRFVDADGALGQPHELVSSWAPGMPVWHGTLDGVPLVVQVRPMANGIRLAHQGIEITVNVYTETEATAARLMPINTAADGSSTWIVLESACPSVPITTAMDTRPVMESPIASFG